MKDLKYNKKINEETQAFTKMIEEYTKKLKKEYEKEMTKMMVELIEDIALNENLDAVKLKEKYINNKYLEKEKQKEKEESVKETESLLEQTTIDGKIYYFQQKENGDVYNNESKIVGKYVEGVIKFTK